MNNEFEKKLVALAPNLYADYGKKNSLMAFGFTCLDSRFDVLHFLSIALEKEILTLPFETRSEYKAAQVKSKFNQLRFYMSKSTDRMDQLIFKAEVKIAELEK